MNDYSIIYTFLLEKGLGSGSESLKILTSMKKDKLRLFYRLMIKDNSESKRINRDLLRVANCREQTNTRNMNQKRLFPVEQVANQNHYLLRYTFDGFKKFKQIYQERQKIIAQKLDGFRLRQKAKYFHRLKANIYDRVKQRLKFEIKGLTQNVFDLRDELRFEKKEKRKVSTTLTKHCREMKKTTE